MRTCAVCVEILLEIIHPLARAISIQAHFNCTSCIFTVKIDVMRGEKYRANRSQRQQTGKILGEPRAGELSCDVEKIH
jgi:hypothetical protein